MKLATNPSLLNTTDDNVFVDNLNLHCLDKIISDRPIANGILTKRPHRAINTYAKKVSHHTGKNKFGAQTEIDRRN